MKRGASASARGLALALVLALWLPLAPPAHAGTERDPEVTDIADHSDRSLDLLSAWLETASDGVVFTIKVASIDKPPVNNDYGVVFNFRGTRYVGVVAFNDDGEPRTDLRAQNFNRQGLQGPDALGNTLRDAKLRTGSPAYVIARIPWDALPRLAPGANLTNIAAGTGTYTPGEGWDDKDFNGGGDTNYYVVEESSIPAFVMINKTGIVTGAVAAGVALVGGTVAGIVLWRRRGRAAARAPLPRSAPPSPPPSSPPSPPASSAERFRLRPK